MDEKIFVIHLEWDQKGKNTVDYLRQNWGSDCRDWISGLVGMKSIGLPSVCLLPWDVWVLVSTWCPIELGSEMYDKAVSEGKKVSRWNIGGIHD